MALTQDLGSDFADASARKRAICLKVATNVKIFRGAVCSRDVNGFLAPNADTAAQANKKMYVSLEFVDTGVDAPSVPDGQESVAVLARDTVRLPAGSLVQTDAGLPVHATDDATLANTSVNSRILGTLDYIDGPFAVLDLGR